MRVYQLKDSCEFYFVAGEGVQINVSENDSNIYCFNTEGLLVRKYEGIGNVFLVFKGKDTFLCSSSTAIGGLFMSGDLEVKMAICPLIASHVIKFCHNNVQTLER